MPFVEKIITSGIEDYTVSIPFTNIQQYWQLEIEVSSLTVFIANFDFQLPSGLLVTRCFIGQRSVICTKALTTYT